MKKNVNTPHNPLRIVVLFGNAASAVQYMEKMDSNWAKAYTVVGAVASKPNASGINYFLSRNISCEWVDWKSYIAQYPSSRELYFTTIQHIIEAHKPDILVNSGFLINAPESFVRAFDGKYINIHPADLTTIDSSSGKRMFTGLGKDAIRKTIEAGCDTIRSTVHYVKNDGINEIDGGRIIAQSAPYVIGLNESVKNLQERLKRSGDPCALINALRNLIAQNQSLS